MHIFEIKLHNHMESSLNIDIAIIDTNVFIKNNSDFLGIRSSTLPLFFDKLSSKGITLLQSDIIDQEVKKHIADSTLVKQFSELKKSLHENEGLFNHYAIDSKLPIDEIDIAQDLYNAYQSNYCSAIMLHYADPKEVFNSYFQSMPPFSETGKKKNEFPDAFILRSIMTYLQGHSESTLLVVSDDKDWEDTLKEFDQVIICKGIDDTMKLLEEDESILPIRFINNILEANAQELTQIAEDKFKEETFRIDEYDFEEGPEINKIYSTEINCDPETAILLKITHDKIIIKTLTSCLVDGEGTVFDEDRSVWDSEDREWIIYALAQIGFKKAIAETECEIQITYNIEKIGDISHLDILDAGERLELLRNSTQVDYLKLTNFDDISLDIDRDYIDEIALDDDDVALNALLEDKGHSTLSLQDIKRRHRC
jgi:hypothetical protein